MATYSLGGVYRSEGFTGGLLAGHTNSKTNSDAVTGQANPYDSRYGSLDPYFIWKVSGLSFSGEALYFFSAMPGSMTASSSPPPTRA